MRHSAVSQKPIMPSSRSAITRFCGGRRLALVEPVAAGARDVLRAVEQQRVGALAVAAGPADLLVVGLGAVGHVEMGHEAHVGAVDAHAEGDRGHDRQRLALAEAAEGGALLDRRQPGVERQRHPSVAAQGGRHPARSCRASRNRRCRHGFCGRSSRLPSWASSRDLGRAWTTRFERWKLATRTAASSRPRVATMSARVRGSAVAVSATRGTPGRRWGRQRSSRYSGRNSWPQADTQCASSIAMIETGRRARRSRRLPDSSRSGET